jgi:hypothetical protein
MTNLNNHLLPAIAATLLGKAVSTLARERCRGNGCPYLKINGKVFYLRADVEAHAAKNTTYHQTKESTK